MHEENLLVVCDSFDAGPRETSRGAFSGLYDTLLLGTFFRVTFLRDHLHREARMEPSVANCFPTLVIRPKKRTNQWN